MEKKYITTLINDSTYVFLAYIEEIKAHFKKGRIGRRLKTLRSTFIQRKKKFIKIDLAVLEECDLKHRDKTYL